MSKTDNEWRPKTVGEYRELAQCIASTTFIIPQHLKEGTIVSILRTFIIPQHLKEGTIEYWLTVTPFHIEQALYHLEFLIHTIRDKDLNILHGGSVTHRGNEQVCYYVQELFLLAWMALDANTGNAWIGGMFEDYDDLYNNHWPKNPQATAFTEAGLSAMEATFAFFDMFHHTVPYIRDISNSSVVEPKPCKAVQAMKEAVKLVLNRILPENEWPTSKIEREIKTLIVQINHELKQYQASTAPEPENKEHDEWLSNKDASAILGVTEGHVSRLTKDGKLKKQGKKLSKISVLKYKHERDTKEAKADFQELQKDTAKIKDQH